jgi:CheY-like chemotaxis protein
MNLCVNARDAMSDGGKLGLAATNVCLTEEHAHLNPLAKPGNYVVLSVSDSGHGIPADIRDRIFDPFFTTKEVGKGTGIGLSTVLGIVRNHGGFVTVYSEVGKGSIFKVYLPIVEAAVIEAVKTAQVAAEGNGELVLVVDDEGPVREAACQVLEKHKFRVLTAGSGGDALRLLLEHRSAIRLVLTDMMMPAIDGLHLIRTSRVLEPKVRFVAMSGLDEEARRSALSGLGVSEILFKPFDSCHLIQAVQRALAA